MSRSTGPIVVAGESLVDLLVRPDGSVVATPGGGPFNVARALARLDRPVAFLGRISTDRFGRILAERLAADGVDLRLAPRTEAPTLLAVAELDDDGAARYRFHTAGTAAVELSAGDIVDGLPADTAALHVGTLGLVLEPMATTIERLVAGSAPDVLVMVDPNCRPAAIDDPVAYRARLARVLDRADLVKVSTDDVAWLEPGIDVVDAARGLLAGGASAALLTDGGRPVRIVTPSEVTVVEVPSTVVVDTVGAGDAFCAGFLAAWTAAGRRRTDLRDPEALAGAVRFGTEVAARTTTRAGAEPPTLAELRGLAPGW